MGKYYYLIAGLPNISLDDSKLPFTLSEFRQELNGMLTEADRKLVDLFFLKFDNRNLLERLRVPDAGPDARGSITYDEFNDLFNALKEQEKPPVNKHIPAYFNTFLSARLTSEEHDGKEGIPWEDRLSALYYAYAMGCGNGFIAAWFELNLDINNLFTAITCRKYGLERADYIVGDNETARALRTSNARDFGLGDLMPYQAAVQRISEESDLLVRERKTDQLKWEWLEEHTFFKTFDIENVFTYVLRLEMIERWASLDKRGGERIFRELVGAMKRGSGSVLEEFKRNNNK
ncbi:MAG: DUF2764 domain-containing protein [Tannerellaceae bacterium]|jgi:hypothetical protein|nr:DUF2764 domain-containing protein [Tannerellaceae bacterium]